MVVLKYIVSVLFFVGSCQSFVGQHQVETIGEDSGYIEYVEMIPEYNAKKKFKFTLKSFLHLLTGKEPQRLYRPVSVFLDDSHQLKVLDQSYQGIIEYAEGEFKPWKVKSKISLTSLVDMCQHRNEAILMTDSYHNQVFIYNEKDRQLKAFSDTLLNQPTGIACDAEREMIYVAETAAHRIAVFDFEGNLIRRIGCRGLGELQFNYPTFLVVGKDGVLYVVDSMNFRIQQISPEGTFITSFGENGDATGSFARPKGIALDSYGHIYVADALFNAVQVFDKNGDLLYYFGNKGTGKGEFMMPMGVYITDMNRIYVTDYLNARIQVYQLNNELIETLFFN
ncbi:6-bladed beta-propeller [Carboxylicivirga marina]|uniref:6-bladed beta-propeller n=1 Tax=Carboxylicivirga marina TaxID=2800988 RepID=UPI002599B121|nr:6-bladed beta-propeller [uncultured Carboxylicivirga sp.]